MKETHHPRIVIEKRRERKEREEYGYQMVAHKIYIQCEEMDYDIFMLLLRVFETAKQK